MTSLILGVCRVVAVKQSHVFQPLFLPKFCRQQIEQQQSGDALPSSPCLCAFHSSTPRENERSLSESLKPELVRRKAEAGRSAFRRQQKRASRSILLDQSFSETVARDSSEPGQIERADLFQEITTRMALSRAEKEFFRLWYVEGLQSYSDLAERLGLDRAALYRLRYKLLKKLATVRRLVREDLERNHADRSFTTISDEDRGWQQHSIRVF